MQPPRRRDAEEDAEKRKKLNHEATKGTKQCPAFRAARVAESIQIKAEKT